MRRDRVAQCLGAGVELKRGREPRIHADQCAAVGLVFAVHAEVGRARGERHHGGADRRERRRDRQLGAELVHFGQVEPQRCFGLPRERHAQRVGGDEGVAVAVAADPVAHAEERRDRMSGQGVFELAVHLRNLPQEGRAVVAQRVLDFVGDGELGGAQHARLPDLHHAGTQQRFVVGQLARGVQGVALLDQLGDRAFGVEDALALHFGRVRGEHRRDVGRAQGFGDFCAADVGSREALQRHRQRPFLQVALALVVIAAAHVVAVFGDVGQVRKVTERADHADRLVAGQVLQQPVECAAGLRVTLQPVRDRELAHALDQLERRLAFLLTDHVTEQATQQPDVVDQRAVFLGGVATRHASRLASHQHLRRGFRGRLDACCHADLDDVIRLRAGRCYQPLPACRKTRAC